ncbi:ion transporter [uncultured Cohaesibacter sp.]|uniref:ion transporter n=1 Tax=uncultured Cohaesibacter sp. TaxID=1002546 RepID=UPI00292EBB7E|nr:ion transporter [uncultured Cohaesibacter sp.]
MAFSHQGNETDTEIQTKERIGAILKGSDPQWGALFERCWAVLIVLSVILIALETEPNLPYWLHHAMYLAESFVVVLFTIEYGLRIWTAKRASKYIFSFWGVIDLLSILPFYLTLGVDLGGLRAIRLLRIFRILKLVRFLRAAERLRRAFADIKDELVVFAFLSSIVIYVSAVGIFFFEHEAQPDKFSSVFQSLWWALATLTTVGYGDIYPITPGGKLFTLLVLLVGLGIVSVPSGLIASSLSRARYQRRQVSSDDAEAQNPKSPTDLTF